MSNARYTPGPWVATEKSVCAPETEDRLGLDVRIYGGNKKDNRANARLIAAAPDLLEALQAMTEIAELTIGWLPTPQGADGPLIQARAAIAKATRGNT